MSGRWKADGGLMFGVVPKVLWEKQKPADENNMIVISLVYQEKISAYVTFAVIGPFPYERMVKIFGW